MNWTVGSGCASQGIHSTSHQLTRPEMQPRPAALSGDLLAKTRDILFDVSRDLLGSASPSGYFTALNPAWELALGFSLEALKNRPFIDFVHPGDRKATRAELAKLFLEGRETVGFENRCAMAGGGWRYLSWQANLRDDLVYFVAHDITSQIVPKDRNLQTSDFVDGFDHAIFTETTDGLISSWNRQCEELYGFGAAEAVGTTAKDLIVPEDRLDEPGARRARLLDGVGVSQVTTRRRNKVGDSLTVTQTASLMRDPEGRIMDIVVMNRDVSGLDLDDPEVKIELDIVAWIARVRDAVDRGRVIFRAQPIVDLRGGSPSYELLCRIPGVEDDLALPDEFMAAAERHGLLEDLDLLAIKEAARCIASGHRTSVNVSIGTVRRKDMVETIAEELKLTGADPSDLTVEITETALMQNQDSGLRFINGLAAIGTGVALDDFGSGLGGFTNLSSLPIQRLKIDVEFIRGLHSSESNQHVVKAVVSLAEAFGLITVAKGVEDELSAELLRELGVDEAQGNFYARPGAIDEILGKPVEVFSPAKAKADSAEGQSKTAFSTTLMSLTQLITGGALPSAVSGSLRPCPVRTQTTVSGLSIPSTTGRPWLRMPATDAAEAGSQKTPSFEASQWYASRICSSVTAATRPREVLKAFIASSQRAGLPIRIAEAIVSGLATGAPSTRGAAPAAWKP